MSTASAQQDETVWVDFQDAPLTDVARFVSAATGRNLMLAPDILDGTRITIISASPVSSDELWPLFVAALSMNGLTMEDRGSFVIIRPAN